jgi:hypothetical protein
MANDPELLDLLAQAHLTRVLIGIESLNQESLDAIDKHQTVEDIRRAGIACRDHGIEVIASIVLGIDTDGPDDLARTTEFAKSIDAYQLQPAVLTPFPGTPVYESLKRDGRMILSGEEHDAFDWTAFDMMNCTFQPRRMSPWKLQMSFCDMARKFYTRRSAVRIGILFGPEYGWRRYGLALMAQWGTLATWAAGTFAKGTSYWRVKHAGWMYADDPANEHRSEPEESSETAADPHAPAAVFSLPDALRAAEKRLAEDRRIVRRRRRVQREERLRPDPFAGVPKRPMPSERAIIPLKMLGIAEMALPVVAAIRLARRHRHA